MALCGQPLAGIVSLKARLCECGAAMEKTRESLFACSRFAFNGGHVQARRRHCSVREQLTRRGVHGHHIGGRKRIKLQRLQIGKGRLSMELWDGRHGDQRVSPPWPDSFRWADGRAIGKFAKKM